MVTGIKKREVGLFTLSMYGPDKAIHVNMYFLRTDDEVSKCVFLF